MRWNCPHCSIELFIDDNRIGNEWSFSRCYSCGGFSLVRKSNVNTIKIEQAPTPQTVLQPTPVVAAPEGAHAAIEHLAQSRAGASHQKAEQQRHKNQVKPNAGATLPAVASQVRQPTAASVEKNPAIAAAAAKIGQTNVFNGRKLPPPLPEKTRQARAARSAPKRNSRWALPVAIGLSGAVAFGSGIYLYVQGQELWNDARGTLSSKERTKDALHLVSTKKSNLVADTINRSAMAPDRTPLSAEPQTPVTAAKSEPSPPTMTVKLTRSDVNLRIGPGLKYPIIGKGDHTISYSVVEWREKWFKIVPNTGPTEQAWVRNDFVKTIKQ